MKEDFVNGFSLNVHDNANELSIFCAVLCVEFRVELYAGMASYSGIRARDFDRGEYSRKPILKNAAGYGAWKVKMETILDADDCWEIVQGTELEPLDLA